MTITATPDITATPPKVTVQINAPAGAVMKSVALYRLANGVKELLRQQPVAGFDSRSVVDIEMPYEVPVVYSWESSYVDQTAITQLWTEPWASAAAWTLVGASWSVSGGMLVWTGADSLTASATRALTAGLYRVVIAAPPVGIQFINFGGFYIDVANSRLVAGSESVSFLPGTGSWTIDSTGSSVVIRTTAGSYAVTSAAQTSMVQFAGAVAKLTASTTWVPPIGAGTGQFAEAPGFIASDEAGNVFVAETLTNRIHVYTTAGVYVSTFGSTGTGNGQFTAIHDITTDGTNVFVADAGRIQKFIPSGGIYVYSAKVGVVGTGNGQFGGQVYGVAAEPSGGRVYATDWSNNRVQRFTNALAYDSQFGSAGTTDGKFSRPYGVAVFGSKVAVMDARVQIFSNALAWEKTLPQGTADGSILNPGHMVGDSSGTLYVVSDQVTPTDQSAARLSKFDTTGTYLGGLLNVAVAFLQDINGSSHYIIRLAYRNSTRQLFLTDPQTDRVRTFTQPRAAIDDVTSSTYGTTILVAETALPVTVSPSQSWLIHPAKPALSFPLLKSDGRRAGLRTLGDISNPSTATVHEILGTDQPVVTTNGPRASDRLLMVVATATRAEELQIKALLRDQTPILIRILPSWLVDFDDGFYSVGDTTRGRFIQLAGVSLRDVALPLISVASPIVNVETSGWSWAALAAEFPTWDSVKAAFATWADVASNTRRPGF